VHDDIIVIAAEEEERVTCVLPVVKAESFVCTVNSTSGHIVAKFSTEHWKKSLVVTKHHVCWLNWINATPFILRGPSNNPPFLPYLHVLCYLDLLDYQAW